MPTICVYVTEAGQERPVAEHLIDLTADQLAHLANDREYTATLGWIRSTGQGMVAVQVRRSCQRHGFHGGSKQALAERLRFDWDWCPVYGSEQSVDRKKTGKEQEVAP